MILFSRLDDDEDVCRPGKPHEGHVEAGQSLRVDLWYSARAKFDAKCHLWCTKDGVLPRKDDGTDDRANQILAQLVKKTSRMPWPS